jgi:hypothetical protein
MVGDAEIGEDEAGGQLGGRFLDGQDIAGEALVEIAVETMLRPRAVSSFMNQGVNTRGTLTPPPKPSALITL